MAGSVGPWWGVAVVTDVGRRDSNVRWVVVTVMPATHATATHPIGRPSVTHAGLTVVEGDQ